MSSYRRLLETAAAHANRIPTVAVGGRAGFIASHARWLVDDVGTGHDHGDDDPGSRFCRLVADRWDDIRDGAGAELLRGEHLWEPLMCEWPMGAYAELTVGVLRNLVALEDVDVFEVGSGVGNLARLVAGEAKSWVRSDVDETIPARLQLPGTVERYDADEAGVPGRADVVVAVNAVHCAHYPLRAVRNMANMLRPGGVLVLGEGAPATTETGMPWAMTWTFGLLDGWWDVGGFLPRKSWVWAMRAAGLDVHTVPIVDDGHDVGGVVVGVRRGAPAVVPCWPVDTTGDAPPARR